MTEFKTKLKKLRQAKGLTQEAVAERLGVTAQTVSKWERGLLSPDIALLPKIALLYQCSIDSLFDMELIWSTEHRRDFEARIHELHIQKDWEAIYQAWIHEIELNPDTYKNYPDVMLHVFRRKLYDRAHLEKLISLADHAEKCCTDDDIRNEIFRLMLQICSESDDSAIREKGRYYYQKLPLLRHSREVYAKYVMEGEEYREQIRKNLIYLIDLAECSVRQLILPDMPPAEKLFYYETAAALYETVLDGKCGGFYDPALLSDYYEIVKLCILTGDTEKMTETVHRILTTVERHTAAEKDKQSPLLSNVSYPNAVPAEVHCRTLLEKLLAMPELDAFYAEIHRLLEKL